MICDDDDAGVKYRYLKIQEAEAWEVHFVERPADATGGMTVAALEGYFREVRAERRARAPRRVGDAS